MAAWIFLALAIATEAIGLTMMKLTQVEGGVTGYLVFYGMIAVSYFFLAKAVKSISMGVAYAIWEGSGVALITMVTACFFEHALTGRQWVGLAMAIIGILLVNAGDVHQNAGVNSAGNCEGSSNAIA